MADSSLFYYHTSNSTLILLVYLDLLHLSSQHHIHLACVILELSIISRELKLLMVLLYASQLPMSVYTGPPS